MDLTINETVKDHRWDTYLDDEYVGSILREHSVASTFQVYVPAFGDLANMSPTLNTYTEALQWLETYLTHPTTTVSETVKGRRWDATGSGDVQRGAITFTAKKNHSRYTVYVSTSTLVGHFDTFTESLDALQSALFDSYGSGDIRMGMATDV